MILIVLSTESFVNYPSLPLVLRLALEGGASCFKTRFAGTAVVPVGSAVSTGVNESEALVRTSESRGDSEDVDSERPAPNSLIPRRRMFHEAFQSRSAVNPHAGHECSRTHNGLSVLTPHAAHSFVVFRGSTGMKCVPSRSHLYSSIRRKVPHAADARLREFELNCIIPATFKSSTATRSYSRA